MLTDPQSITIAGAASSLPRLAADPNSGTYSNPDGTLSLKVQEFNSKNAKRTVISLQANKIAADPITALNTRKQDVISITFSRPVDGFTITEMKDQFTGLVALLSASSNATLIKILGGEK